MSLIFVDCESPIGEIPVPGITHMTEFGAVLNERVWFHGKDDTKDTFRRFDEWLSKNSRGRPVFISDNPAYDWKWIDFGFWTHFGRNPFGFSARRIGDFYAGLTGDFSNTQKWKNLRVTPHDHNPVNDAMGNYEAFRRMLKGERG